MADDTVSLRDFVQRQLDALAKQFEDEKQHVKERGELLATNFSQWKVDNDRRLEGMNEKQAHFIQAEAKFVDQKINDAEHRVLESRITALERAESHTKGSSGTNIAWIAAIISILGMIAAFIWRR